MKIAVFHPDFNALGGAEKLALAQAHWFRQAGHDVELLTFTYQASVWSDALRGLTVNAMCDSGHPMPTRPSPFAQPEQVAWASAMLARGTWDAVIAHNYPANAILGHSNYGGRKIWYCHEPPRSLYLSKTHPYLHRGLRRNPLMVEGAALRQYRSWLPSWTWSNVVGGVRKARLYEKDGVKKIDEIWVNSSFTRKLCESVYGRPDGRIAYPLVDFERFEVTTSSACTPPSTEARVLVHSRLEPVKNVDTLLRALALFRKDGFSRLHVDVVGAGSHRAELERLAVDLGFGSSCTFHGYLPQAELDAIYGSCHVFALLPFDEPFGMVFPEAAGSNLLLIGPDHGGPLEIFEGGRLGEVADPFSPSSAAEALRRTFALTPADASERRRRAYVSCQKRFATKAAGERLLQLLLEPAK